MGWLNYINTDYLGIYLFQVQVNLVGGGNYPIYPRADPPLL